MDYRTISSHEEVENEDEYGDTAADRRLRLEGYRASISDALYQRLSQIRNRINQFEARYNRLFASVLPVREGDIVEVQHGSATERVLIEDISVYSSEGAGTPWSWYASGPRIRTSDGKPGKRTSAVYDGAEFRVIERKEQWEDFMSAEVEAQLAELDEQMMALQERREALLARVSPIKEDQLVRFSREQWNGQQKYTILVDHVSYAGIKTYGDDEGTHVWIFEGRRLKKDGEIGLRRERGDTTLSYEILSNDLGTMQQ
jgi:hypothetical protein